MFWAIYYDDLPFLARNFVRALGGPCNTKKVSFSFPAEFMGLKEAILIEGDRRQSLPVDLSKSSYSLSLFNNAYSDDAVIELVYGEAKADISEPRKRNFNGLSVAVGL